MIDDRPDPERLLAHVAASEARQARGKLKIFFGASPGVGKTYAMLEAGRKAAKEGVDVLVGYVEPHARPETQALVLGLDVLARRAVTYRGRTLLEFDLEAALARRPQLILVDELAHANAPGLTHAKRWQDVDRLLRAGIDVFTTVNVQHLESLNDVVAQVTGVAVRETIPDSVFEQADEVELVDLPPDDLLERMREGKVYLGDQALAAAENFFRKGNLIALRELALRRMAERVDAQMEDWRALNVVSRVWPAAERLLVCVSASPHSTRLVRAARRMASSLRAPWIVLHVETPADAAFRPDDRERIAQTLHLAEELGAETVTLAGANFADDVLRYARSRNVTKLVVGKPQQPRWRDRLLGSFVYDLTRKCGEIDVYVISGERDAKPRAAVAPLALRRSPWRYLGAVAGVVLVTLVCWGAVGLFPSVGVSNLVMAYLLGVVATAVWLGRGPSALAAVLGVAVFDFWFVPPTLTFVVSDTQYLLTFAVMLVTGLVISTLTSRIAFQAEAARQRERRTAALYAMSRELLDGATIEALVRSAERHIGEVFDGRVLVWLRESPTKADRRLSPAPAAGFEAADAHETAVAQWVFDHGEIAGRDTDTLPSAAGIYVPLLTLQGGLGVLGVQPGPGSPSLAPDQIRLLQTFAGQLAMAIQRVWSVDQARHVQLQIETERLRNSLLSAVSHDLRTPLAAITGASSALVDNADSLDPAARRELAESIFVESDRLNRLVANLLDMTRLESGALALRREWQSLEEVIGSALARLRRLLAGRRVEARVPADLPLLSIDGLLIGQVLINLIENAVKYSPPEAAIEISAGLEGDHVRVDVSDRGPGVPSAEKQAVFEKFFRSAASQGRSGAGLGLAICRGIVQLHGGTIGVADRPGGGATFSFTLPRTGTPPQARPID